jgi:hypothetical protein
VIQRTLADTAHAITPKAGHDELVRVVDEWLGPYIDGH